MEELKRFQGSTFDTIARRKLVENRDTILELTGKIQELQNEINCMIDSRDFQDAESVRSGHSHVASQPVSFPHHPVPGGMVSRSLGMPSRKNGPPSIWDTHGISGNVFCKSRCVILSTLSTRIASMEFMNRRAAPFVYSGDTTNQLAEMLTTGSLTRDEWDHLLRLLNIMNFSMFSCSHCSFRRKAECHVQGKHG